MTSPVDLAAVLKDPGMLTGYPPPVLRRVVADGVVIIAAALSALADVTTDAPATPPPPPPLDVITEKEAAAMIGRRPSTLQEHRRNGRKPFVDWLVPSMGLARPRYFRHKIDDWLARAGRNPVIGRAK